MRRLVGLVALGIVVACSGRQEPPASPEPAVATQKGPPLVIAAAPASSESPVLGSAPLEVATGGVRAFAPFGAVIGMTEGRPWSARPAVAPAPSPAAPHPYEKWRERRKTKIGFGYLSILELSPDERVLLVASEEEALLRTYDFKTLAPAGKVSVPGFQKFDQAAFAYWPLPDETPRAVFASPDGIALIDAKTGYVRPLSSEPGDSLRFSDDHSLLGVTRSRIPEQRSVVTFFEPDPALALKLVASFQFAERVEEWALDREHRRLAVVHYPSDTVEVLDLTTRSLLFKASVPQYSNSVDFSPDGSLLAVGGASLVVFDIRTGKPAYESKVFGNNIHSVRFSPGGDALAVSSYEGKVRIYDTAKPAPELALKKVLQHAGTANVYALVWTRDGSELVSSSGDQTVRVWGE